LVGGWELLEELGRPDEKNNKKKKSYRFAAERREKQMSAPSEK
jgi:hypothetical protein